MAHIVFTLEDGSEVFADLNADIVTVGRHPESMVMLASGSVSGQHATIKRRGDSFFVQDLGTTNGTRVNGVEVEEVKLEHGDLVAMGDVAGYFYLTDEGASVVTAHHGEEALEPVQEPVVMPIPDEPSPPQAEPSLFLPDKYSPVPRAPKTKQQPSSYLAGPYTKPVKRYKESSSFGGFLLFLLFLGFAFIVGLHVRHGQEAGTVFFLDVLEKFRTKEVVMESVGDGAPDHKEAPSAPSSETPDAPNPVPTPAPPAPTPAPAPASTPEAAPATNGEGDSSMSGAAPSMTGDSMMGGN